MTACSQKCPWPCVEYFVSTDKGRSSLSPLYFITDKIFNLRKLKKMVWFLIPQSLKYIGRRAMGEREWAEEAWSKLQHKHTNKL